MADKPRNPLPRDKAPPGTAGTGEDACRRCSCTGRVVASTGGA